jgi:hypothetical protein
MLLCKNLIDENVCKVVWPQSKFQKDFVNCLQSSNTYISNNKFMSACIIEHDIHVTFYLKRLSRFIFFIKWQVNDKSNHTLVVFLFFR